MLLCDIPLVQVVLAERHDSNRKGHLDPLSTLRSTLSSRPASIGWNSGFNLFVERSFGMFSGVAWVLSAVPATSMEYPLIRWLRCPRPYRGLRPGCGSIRGQVLVFGFKVLLIARGSGARTVNERT